MDGPRRPKKSSGLDNWRQLAWSAFCAVGAGLAGAAMLYAFAESGLTVPTPLGNLPVFPEDRVEPSSPEVLAAKLDIRLTQLGTDQPFRGSGTPGLHVSVTDGGTLVGWMLEGWANHTSSSTVSVCNSPSIHYSPHDWMYQIEAGTGRGFYRTVASTVVQRMGPDGDQCLPRSGETGIWTVKLCLEGDGVLSGTRRDDKGGVEADLWDRCEYHTVSVQPTGFPVQPRSQPFFSPRVLG